MQNWYFTFGQNHKDKDGNSLAHSYVKIRGTWGAAREKMFMARGAVWSMQYNEEDFIPQIKEFNLKELKLTAVELPDNEKTK